jgi:hypothetical protein
VGALIANGFTFGVLPLAGAVGLVAGAVSQKPAARWLTAAGLWIAATVALPGHALVVYLQGEGPLVC